MENRLSIIPSKLYTKKSILISVFIGGPLAAGYLIYENFNALNENDKAKRALWIGVGITFLLILLIIIIPDKNIDKIPNFLIPLLTTLLTSRIIDSYQQKQIEEFKKINNSFYSVWRAVLVGVLSAVIFITIIFITASFKPLSKAENKYHSEMELFYSNEEKSLEFYEMLGSKTDFDLVRHIEDVSIPAWKQNIEVLNKTNQINDLPEVFTQINQILLEYSELRIETFLTFKKGILGNPEDYDLQLERLHSELNEVLIRYEDKIK